MVRKKVLLASGTWEDTRLIKALTRSVDLTWVPTLKAVATAFRHAGPKFDYVIVEEKEGEIEWQKLWELCEGRFLEFVVVSWVEGGYLSVQRVVDGKLDEGSLHSVAALIEVVCGE